MDNFDATAEESITSFVNKYPLTVPYFQDRELSDDGLDMTLESFRERNDLTRDEMDRELQHHLAQAVVPDGEDCSSLCLKLVLCHKKLTAGLTACAVILVGILMWLF